MIIENNIFSNNLAVTNINNSLKNGELVEKVNELLPKFSVYEGRAEMYVTYISDIHLLHHLSNRRGRLPKLTIQTIVKELYSTMYKEGIIVFAGDISSDPTITTLFYKTFVKYNDLLSYRDLKNRLLQLKEYNAYVDMVITKCNRKIERLLVTVENVKKRLSQYIDFSSLLQYKNRHHARRSWMLAMQRYVVTPSYLSNAFQNECNEIIL